MSNVTRTAHEKKISFLKAKTSSNFTSSKQNVQTKEYRKVYK